MHNIKTPKIKQSSTAFTTFVYQNILQMTNCLLTQFRAKFRFSFQEDTKTCSGNVTFGHLYLVTVCFTQRVFNAYTLGTDIFEEELCFLLFLNYVLNPC